MDLLAGLLGFHQEEEELRGRGRRQRRQDDFTDDEDSDEDEDDSHDPRRRKSRKNMNSSTDEILDRIIGSCADFGEMYQRKYGNLTRTCSDHHSLTKTKPTSNTRYPSRSRKNNNHRRNSRDVRPTTTTTTPNKNNNYRNNPPRHEMQHPSKEPPFSLGGTGIEIPVHFNNNDDVSAVTGITLEEMAQRAAMKRRNHTTMILEQHQEEEDPRRNKGLIASCILFKSCVRKVSESGGMQSNFKIYI